MGAIGERLRDIVMIGVPNTARSVLYTTLRKRLDARHPQPPLDETPRRCRHRGRWRRIPGRRAK